MAVQVVKVEGLREVNRALKNMGDGLDKELKAEAKDIAEVVARDARRRVPVVSGQAQKSIKAGATQKGAYVQGGKASVPYYAWLDFGSRNPVSGRPRSVGPWKGSGGGPKQGRFIYPALGDNRREVEVRTKKVVKVARKRAGL
jgi:hypothetical protein